MKIATLLHLVRFVEFCLSSRLTEKLNVLTSCGELLRTISLEFALDHFGSDSDELELCLSIINALLAYLKAIEGDEALAH